MYIPAWILVGIAIAGIAYFSKKKPKTITATQSDSHGNTAHSSYRLAVSIEPNWYEIYMKIQNPKDDNEREKLTTKLKKIKKDQDVDMCGRRYTFIEFYDAASGMMTRHQTVHHANGKSHSSYVDEFRDRGPFFESEDTWEVGASEERRKERERHSIEIGECFIRNNIYDRYIGGSKLDFDYTKEDYIFRFPLHDMFNLLYALGSRFYEAEQNLIMKWPESIAKKLEEGGIKYETHFEYDPKIFEFEKHDKELYERLGKPTVAMAKASRSNMSYMNSNTAFCSFSLKLFRPDEEANDRIVTGYSAVKG